ncbi:MAG: biotin transporter BioY [Clostridia bacterium]|nr:biotin transporter BioY [Clostridia bacterium]
MNLRRNLLVALMAAVLCVLSPWAIPMGPVPITLATLGVYLAAGTLGPKGGPAAVGLYLALGAVGVPIFAGFSGGAGPLVGLTGGYLWGYLPCALLAGLLAERRGRFALPLAFLVGTAAMYTVGTVWYMVQTHGTLGGALFTCVLPFLPADGVKIAVTSLLIPALRRHIP